ncbi:olfactory receptor 52N2-like [Protopterus annectens]|uniref:olfactory receptor 52N2-like n=1 Tax=Protopterus annectens TaxID=7888 RepID=UPI001CF9FFAC|nr:olfactory receptor 52N2-like [Protopterus annectens]
MSDTNFSKTQNMVFLLVGFPGIPDLQCWFSAPFLIMFTVALFGNLLVLLITINEESLHEPIYYFISLLSIVDFIAVVVVFPLLLKILWFGSQSVQFDICFMQMFFVTFTWLMESTVLTLMAYDRYVAVCKPLRYSSILTNTFIIKATLFFTLRSLFMVLPVPVLARMLPYCNANTIHSVYCEYPAVISVACSHTTISDNYLYIIFLLIGVPDATLIGLSYYMIIRAALKLSRNETRQKVFNTCSSHIFVIALYYLSAGLSLLVSLFENIIPAYIRIIFAVLSITIPPTLNPLIYGIKNKEIWKAIIKHLGKVRLTLTGSSHP